MRPKKALLVLLTAGLVAACVTINVYFPAAAAEDAANRFIDEVLGEDVEAGEDPQTSNGIRFRFDPLFFISSAHAQQADISISTPAIKEIQSRMAQRYSQHLEAWFDSGAIGLTNDAMIDIRDRAAVSLSERNQLNTVVNQENRDRNAVYREIAVANGHPEWESDIRSTFARQWIARAQSGWYYQDSSGNWTQK